MLHIFARTPLRHRMFRIFHIKSFATILSNSSRQRFCFSGLSTHLNISTCTHILNMLSIYEHVRTSSKVIDLKYVPNIILDIKHR